MAADRTPIKCWGSQNRVLKAAGYHFSWTFLLAAVAFPILGADFLENFDLWVDLRRRRLYRPGRHHVPLSAPPVGCNAAPIGRSSGRQLANTFNITFNCKQSDYNTFSRECFWAEGGGSGGSCGRGRGRG